MAARESQGLQIAVILLVLLVAALGITTYVFYAANDKSKLDAEAANQRAQEEQGRSRTYLAERNELKVMIGHSEETPMDEIQEAFGDDMKTFVADEGAQAPTVQNYRQVPGVMQASVIKLEKQLADSLRANTALRAEKVALENTYQTKLSEAETSRDNALAAQAEAEKKMADDRKSLEAAQAKLQDEKVKLQGTIAQTIDGSKKQVDAANKERDQAMDLVEAFKVSLKEKEPKVGDVPDGRIIWVNQKEDNTWINLGTSDLLRPQMTFSVFEKGEVNIALATVKGKIEVTRVNGSNEAEARILEEDVTNPIMPGDQIFTPIWSPGVAQKFAIVGMIDLDGDGEDDTDDLRNLIQSSGGEVAAWVDAEGNINGELTPEVRYLIDGKTPTEKTAAAVLTAYSQMREMARQNGVELIQVSRLQERMGWQSTERLVRLGRTSRLEELEAEAERERDFKPRRPMSAYDN
ncbi:hypothetical protein [Blastopirellula retiformator]|uniref:Uncharacterized protein n=1 Tax=Blastopirellula retiformator TaxID=2527970 RepID=A0A5C5V2H2_9BACT|nr:hypothetical protein [Blastopirellula retiformator]TWT31997.1 hypothetical protein Enr8_39230 [Blastopirellula retiformator]